MHWGVECTSPPAPQCERQQKRYGAMGATAGKNSVRKRSLPEFAEPRPPALPRHSKDLHQGGILHLSSGRDVQHGEGKGRKGLACNLPDPSSSCHCPLTTNRTLTEVVYYTGAVGVVFNKEKWEKKRPSQRFFFGHDNDIMCLALHPNRRFVATGQQKNTGPNALPYVCIWDVDTCNMLQKLDHDRSERS